MSPIVYVFRAIGETDCEKNPKLKISCQTPLKVVTNEKGEAVVEVVTIICKWGRWCWMFFVILMGCHLV
jgi:hypothetical protein